MNPMKFGESIETRVSNRELEFTRLDDGEVDVRMCDGKPALSKDWVSIDKVWVVPKSDRMRPGSVDDNEFSSNEDALMDGLLAQKLDDVPSDEKIPDNNETKRVIPYADILENVQNTQIKNKKDEFNNMCAYYGAATGEFIELADGSCKWIHDDDDMNTPKRRQMNRTARNILVDNVMKTPDTSNEQNTFYPTQKVGNPWVHSCQHKSNPELDEILIKGANKAKEMMANEKIQGGCKEPLTYDPETNSYHFNNEPNTRINSNVFSVNHTPTNCPNTSRESVLNCAINYTPKQQEFLDTIKNMKMDRNLTIKIKYNHENMKETRVFKFY
jgi:hypothetical protein